MGFVIERSYEAVDDPDDVYQDEEGVWHIKAGARVRVRIRMVADNRRYHVALVDRLPAGLEIVNPGLAVSGSVPQDPDSSEYRYNWWWNWPWYQHQNLRDERVEAFTTLLWDGVYEYTYTWLARLLQAPSWCRPPRLRKCILLKSLGVAVVTGSLWMDDEFWSSAAEPITLTSLNCSSRRFL